MFLLFLSLHIPLFYNTFDQCLFCCYEKLFQQVHKKGLKKVFNQEMIGF